MQSPHNRPETPQCEEYRPKVIREYLDPVLSFPVKVYEPRYAAADIFRPYQEAE